MYIFLVHLLRYVPSQPLSRLADFELREGGMESIVIEHVDLPAPDVTRAPEQRETELRHALHSAVIYRSRPVGRDEVSARVAWQDRSPAVAAAARMPLS